MAVLEGKRRALRFSILLVIAAILPNIVVTLRGETNFPGQAIYWFTNGVSLSMCAWGLVTLRQLENVKLVERVGLAASLFYLITWDIVAFVSHYQPRAEFLMTNVVTFLLANALLCLVVERRYLLRSMAGVFAAHELLTWGNLLHFPWGRVQDAQLTTDLLMIATIVFLSLIGSFQHLISTSRQETDLVRLLVNTDELTGLANSRSISAQLDALPQCAVLLIEVDDFEGLLIDLGDEQSEQLVCYVARTLRHEVGRHGSCGRWGNSQFVVILPYASPQFALGLASGLQRKLTTLDTTEPFTVSIGVAVASAGVVGIDLLHDAARRLAQAQAAGGDRIVADTPAPSQATHPQDQEAREA